MTAPTVTEAAVPRLGVGVRLHHDAVRDTWGLLAPERLFKLDSQATEIMKLVDGNRSVGEISNDLAARYHAPRDVIARDVCGMLQGLADKNVVHV